MVEMSIMRALDSFYNSLAIGYGVVIALAFISICCNTAYAVGSKNRKLELLNIPMCVLIFASCVMLVKSLSV